MYEKTKQAKIFISFSGRDRNSADDLRRLVEKSCLVRKSNCHVYLSPSSNVPGEQWQERIAQEIRDSDIVIVVWSECSSTSIVQLIEIGATWILDKTVIPIIKGTGYSTLPSILEKLHALRWVQVRDELPIFLADKINEIFEEE